MANIKKLAIFEIIRYNIYITFTRKIMKLLSYVTGNIPRCRLQGRKPTKMNNRGVVFWKTLLTGC